jgi:hypothetical protein
MTCATVKTRVRQAFIDVYVTPVASEPWSAGALVGTDQIATNPVNAWIISAFVDIYLTISTRIAGLTDTQICLCSGTTVPIMNTWTRGAVVYVSLAVVSLPALWTDTLVIIHFVDTDMSDRTDHLRALIDVNLAIQS